MSISPAAGASGGPVGSRRVGSVGAAVCLRWSGRHDLVVRAGDQGDGDLVIPQPSISLLHAVLPRLSTHTGFRDPTVHSQRQDVIPKEPPLSAGTGAERWRRPRDL